MQPPLPGGPACPFGLLPPGVEGGIGGEISNDPHHFQVDELPAYPLSGTGEHFFVRVRKTGLTTPEVRTLLAEAAGVPERDLGLAGRKDRHAVTTQWFSMQKPPVDPGHPQLELLEVTRHGNKLRLGHLVGNRFGVRITGVQHPQRLPALLAELARGVPNYYGAQRFGRFGLEDGLRLLAEPRRRVKDPEFLASTVQSAVFNHWLGARVAAGLLHRAIAGDILRKRATGGLFVCEAPDVDTPRVEAGELDPTGPMPGPRTWAATGDAAVAEDAALAAVGLTPEQLAVLGRFAEGTRRQARVQPTDLKAEFVEVDGGEPGASGVLDLTFTLPKGAFATVLLGALIDPSQPFARTEEVS